MENEELFAGEPAVDAQQRARLSSASGKSGPLRVHTEPLLVDDDHDDYHDDNGEDDYQGEQSSEGDTRPRWRRAHVSYDNRCAPRPLRRLI